MSSYLNFIFCFDKNYNLQAQTCIISLLEKVSEPINVFVIYSEPFSSEFFSAKINDHKMLNNLEVFSFNEKFYEFPNIDEGHVSMATYYRFFISNYISLSYEYLIYMDTDIICVNDPTEKLKTQIVNFQKSGHIIGASIEHFYGSDSEVFSRLDLQDNYFNAGVMLINYKLWSENNIGDELLTHMKAIKEKVKYWDQDVLNSYFETKFFTLSQELNYATSTRPEYKKDFKKITKDIFFLHFSGKIKPWYIKGTDCKVSEFYHRSFRLINDRRYHLLKRNKKLDAMNLFSLIVTFKVFKLDYTISFITEALKHLYFSKKTT